MLKKHFYNILVIILSLIVIGFLANPCVADNNNKKCRDKISSYVMDQCFRRKRDVIDADEKIAIINFQTRTVSGMDSDAWKSRQPAVAIAPIIEQLYLARSSEPKNDGRLLSEKRDGVGSESHMTIEEIEEIYSELFARSPRYSPGTSLDNALKEQLARCCQNVELCFENSDHPIIKCEQGEIKFFH